MDEAAQTIAGAVMPFVIYLEQMARTKINDIELVCSGGRVSSNGSMLIKAMLDLLSDQYNDTHNSLNIDSYKLEWVAAELGFPDAVISDLIEQTQLNPDV